LCYDNHSEHMLLHLDIELFFLKKSIINSNILYTFCCLSFVTTSESRALIISYSKGTTIFSYISVVDNFFLFKCSCSIIIIFLLWPCSSRNSMFRVHLLRQGLNNCLEKRIVKWVGFIHFFVGWDTWQDLENDLKCTYLRK
jgi:hypothetical protein